MKKLLVVLMILGVVGCSSKGTEPQPSETPDPEPTEGTHEDFTESKINIDLYKVDEYYPVVDGVVTYPDGTIEEFSNGTYVDTLDGTGATKYKLYEYNYTLPDSIIYGTYEEALKDGSLYYTVGIENILPVAIEIDLPKEYVFVHSNYEVGEVIDGVFGIEYTDADGKKPYVIYRYSNYIPQGYSINESFRIITEAEIYYLWRQKEFDILDDFVGVENLRRLSVIWWGGFDGDSFNPHIYAGR